MADLDLNVIILDLNVQKAASAFLRKCPMPQIEDPENPGQMINAFPNLRAYVEDWLAEKLLRAINHGIDLQALDFSERLTKAIFAA